MHFIVTAGPTYEPLDQVRRLTNFSTGKLGVGLANFLATKGHRVTLLKGYYAVPGASADVAETTTFTTTQDLHQHLQTAAASSVDAVFHAAAVSDFRFGKVYTRASSGDLKEVRAGKVPTGSGPLLAELVATPKLIAQLRVWFAQARLIGWKYEVDGARERALAAGADQIQRCRTNACVVNGPAYGEGFGFVQPQHDPVHLDRRDALFEFLERFAIGKL